MNWIEVTDSAIKIGLGAVIAAVATYAHSKSKHRQDLRASQVAREFELLKVAAEAVEIFSRAAISYWARMSDYSVATRAGLEASEAIAARAQSAHEELQEKFAELRRSESLLALLGQNDASRSIESYGDMVVAFRKRFRSQEALSDEEIRAWREKILQSRTEVFKQLNLCYQGLAP